MKNRLRVLRAERRADAGRGWSQHFTARRANISPFRYWQIESSTIDPTDDEIEALAQIFGVSTADVFPEHAVQHPVAS
jgi:transcriptional regulator with XRE-family HTH domain